MAEVESNGAKRPDSASPVPSSATPRLPPSSVDAEVRGVLPFCPVRARFGVSFDVKGHDEPVRLALSESGVRFLLLVLGDYLRSRAGNQSAGSSLMPSVDGSTPEDGQSV